MDEKNNTRLMELCDIKDFRSLVTELEELNEADIAEFLDELSAADAAVVFRMLKKDMGAEVFAFLSPDTQESIILACGNEEIERLIEQLFVDDAVDMLEEMPAGVVKKVLKNASVETRRVINRFLNYPADSAGSIMTAEFMDLKKQLSVQDAISLIRRTAVDRETMYVCYVIDERRKLLGVVSFRDLIFASPTETVEGLMEDDFVSCTTTDDRETAAALMSKYDLQALPVVDTEGRLCGIVTYDDAFDVMEEETTEDFHRYAAVAPMDNGYKDTSVFEMSRHRIVWLLVLMLASVLSGLVIGRYEFIVAAVPLLVSFIPVITGTGGNAGTQSSTLIIRGIATGEITLRDWGRILVTELSVALLCGVTLACVNFARVIIFNPSEMAVAVSVSLAVLAAVIIAKVIGACLPLLAKAIKLDPALMAAPLITTVTDTLSLLVYFGIASAMLAM